MKLLFYNSKSSYPHTHIPNGSASPSGKKQQVKYVKAVKKVEAVEYVGTLEKRWYQALVPNNAPFNFCCSQLAERTLTPEGEP